MAAMLAYSLPDIRFPRVGSATSHISDTVFLFVVAEYCVCNHRGYVQIPPSERDNDLSNPPISNICYMQCRRQHR